VLASELYLNSTALGIFMQALKMKDLWIAIKFMKP